MTGESGRQVPAAEVNNAAFEHEQLKQWTDDADPGGAQNFADEWTQPGTALIEAADTLMRASAESESGWTGAAAAAMRARLSQISTWSSSAGTQIATASQSVARQSEAADAARRAMPEPVPYDPGQMIRDAGRGGLVDFAALPQQLFAQKQKHDAAHEEAVRVVSERDSAMNSAAAEVAVFQPPPTLDGPGGERTLVDSGGPGASGESTPGGAAPVRAPAIPRQGGGPEFLQEPGPDGIFDSAVRTAPAVIGAPDDE